MNPDDCEMAMAELSCEKPCHPDSGCPMCADYWERMIYDGFWDERKKEWTAKGFREMSK